MIIVTGAAGFIGSCLISSLLENGRKDIVAVDDFTVKAKAGNLEGKPVEAFVHRDDFIRWLPGNASQIEFIFHIGARTDTTEFDERIFERLNTGYTRQVWEACSRHGIPLVYASSAATYGLGEYGYTDNHEVVEMLKPLNPYGVSKNEFDKWALKQPVQPPFWAGMKFFNVYGPNEYHKGRMASVIMHAYHQIMDTGKVRLFRSHRPDYGDGMQLRDFIYVKDVVSVLTFMMEKRPVSGLYNLGTGQARSFMDLAGSTFAALGKAPVIDFVDTPVDIRDKYQYFTEAAMDKLKTAGYSDRFHSLEEGVSDYVSNYLSKNRFM